MQHRIHTLLLFVWLVPLALSAQITDNPTAVEYYQSGELALLDSKPEQALRFFQKALKAKPGFSAARRGMAVCYELLREYEKAAEQYELILASDSLFSRVLYFQAAEAHYKTGHPELALQRFQQFEALQQWAVDTFSLNTEREQQLEAKYLKRLPSSMKACEVSMDSVQFINITAVENLGPNINTKADDYFPFLTNDQSRMYFTRKTAKGDEDLYESRLDKDAWARASALRPLNSSFDEGMSTLVRDGRLMFYTVCGREGVLGSCDIWQAELDQDFEVASVMALEGYANSKRWESQASISCDGSTLFFASNREGGLGGTDLWYSERSADGRWGDPVNLGATVNTELDEEAPFITNDGQTLYFSSNGHPGLGDQDIFMSWKDPDGKWSAPINLGPPVNSAFRELGFFLTADGQNGYFASDRPEDNLGGLDIFRFRLDSQLHSKPITFVEGFVIDSTLEMPLRATVEIAGRHDIEVGKDGRFFLCVPAGDTLFTQVNKKFFQPYEHAFIIPEWDNRQFYTLELLLRSTFDLPNTESGITPPPRDTLQDITAKGSRKQLKTYTHSVFFDFDEAKMRPEEREKLMAFLKPMLGQKAEDIRIVGFSDDIGTDVYNLRLSEDRAKEIAVLIMEKGLEVNHIYMEGKGKIKDDGPKELNRRVEVKISVLE